MILSSAKTRSQHAEFGEVAKATRAASAHAGKALPFVRHHLFLPGAPFFRGNFRKGESAQACLFPLEFLETLGMGNRVPSPAAHCPAEQEEASSFSMALLAARGCTSYCQRDAGPDYFNLRG